MHGRQAALGPGQSSTGLVCCASERRPGRQPTSQGRRLADAPSSRGTTARRAGGTISHDRHRFAGTESGRRFRTVLSDGHVHQTETRAPVVLQASCSHLLSQSHFPTAAATVTRLVGVAWGGHRPPPLARTQALYYPIGRYKRLSIQPIDSQCPCRDWEFDESKVQGHGIDGGVA